MMPIRGTPILIHLMRFYAAQGFTKFVLAAGWRKEILDDYFDGRFPEWTVDVVDTGPASDTGERILRCEPYVGDTFFATYGDGLGNVDLDQLLQFHRQSRALTTVTSVPLRSQYGTVHFTGEQQVQAFQEKPTIRDYWINAGFFVFEKSVFDQWQGTNLENHVLPKLASLGVLYTYLHEGFWKSMDTSKDQQEFETILSNGAPPWMEFRQSAFPLAAS
jgi:glucose-1-phosphate cytidylyltransferase